MKTLRTLLLSSIALVSATAMASDPSSVAIFNEANPPAPQPQPSPQPLPQPVRVRSFSDGGQGKACKTPTYTCNQSKRTITCNAEAKDESLTSHCEAVYGDIGVVHCYVTDNQGALVSNFADACP